MAFSGRQDTQTANRSRVMLITKVLHFAKQVWRKLRKLLTAFGLRKNEVQRSISDSFPLFNVNSLQTDHWSRDLHAALPRQIKGTLTWSKVKFWRTSQSCYAVILFFNLLKF